MATGEVGAGLNGLSGTRRRPELGAVLGAVISSEMGRPAKGRRERRRCLVW
jgi:hypothetical protein